jgi:hypothetical protein
MLRVTARRTARLGSVLAWFCSCHSSRGKMQDKLYYVEPGAPDPLACRADADCTADVVTKPDGCCMVNNPYAQSCAWRDWLRAHTSSPDCSSVDCSTNLRMAPPPSCASDVHCVAGRCADSCK